MLPGLCGVDEASLAMVPASMFNVDSAITLDGTVLRVGVRFVSWEGVKSSAALASSP